jgi:hypothetical protein
VLGGMVWLSNVLGGSYLRDGMLPSTICLHSSRIWVPSKLGCAGALSRPAGLVLGVGWFGYPDVWVAAIYAVCCLRFASRIWSCQSKPRMCGASALGRHGLAHVSNP